MSFWRASVSPFAFNSVFANGAVTAAFGYLYNELGIHGNSKFRARVEAARNRLPSLDAALNEIDADPRMIDLRQGRYGQNEFIGSVDANSLFGTPNPTLIWDAASGLKFPSGVQSATLGLFHEVTHALGWLASPDAFSFRVNTGAGQYGTVEESRVIRGPEAAAARFLGEPGRYCHNCGTIVPSNR